MIWEGNGKYWSIQIIGLLLYQRIKMGKLLLYSITGQSIPLLTISIP